MEAEERPKGSISPAANLGMVKLKVRDIERVRPFYEETLGFKVLHADEVNVQLGVEAERVLVWLQSDPQAPLRERGTVGLYHYAILMPGRSELARVLQRLFDKNYPLQGAADHYVSEAVYLADPEGNGIEVYADRPRDAWYSPAGEMRMGTVALDVDDLLSSRAEGNDSASELPAGTRIGHIHLHVPDLEQAIRVYRDIIGFDLMLRYGPSAGFLSAGGYHHHIGVNTWAGEGAPEPTAGSTGLLEYSVLVPDTTDLAAIEARAVASGLDAQREDHALELEDPSGSRVVIQSNQGE